MTPIFFHHFLIINIFQISQDKFIFEKRFLNQICGFFQHFLALFETFISLYNDPCIEFELSGKFWSKKPVFLKIFFETVLKGPFWRLCTWVSQWESTPY